MDADESQDMSQVSGESLVRSTAGSVRPARPVLHAEAVFPVGWGLPCIGKGQ